MQPRRAFTHPAPRNDARVGMEGFGLRIVTLIEAHTLPPQQVNRR